ncbi:hypothetical protein T02_2581 [Trichinella nativa]|uniref:Uncharacterized protein n=1 Tax=Trichinella nativa TaxID=6335 RepID=A0A0V1L4Q8_9BILA|nr:hypothetical protein T02_2581 [Trichinella nativa]
MVSKTLRSLLFRADRLKADQQQVNFIAMQSKKSNRSLLYRVDKANSFTIAHSNPTGLHLWRVENYANVQVAIFLTHAHTHEHTNACTENRHAHKA